VKSYKNRFPNAIIKLGGIGASLTPEAYEKETGIKPHFGIIPEVEESKPDYSLFPNIDYSIAFTTRSCPRRCGWCMVHRMEKEFIEIKNWEEYINHDKPKITFWDNNFFASSKEHQQRVFNKLIEWQKNVDFNQGLDARLFNKFHAENFAQIKIHPLRFAFDSMATDKHIQKALNLAYEYGINDTSAYMLYNFMGTPEQLYYRMKELVKLKCDVFPMKYQPLDALEKDQYIGKHFNKTFLDNFQKCLRTHFTNSNIGKGLEIERFNAIFGKDDKAFKKIFNNPDFDPQKIDLSMFKHKKKKEITEHNLKSYDEETEKKINQIIKENDGMVDRNGAIKILENI